MKKSLLLIVTGGIANYKSLEIISLCKNNNIDVDVVLTESAKKFITPLTFNSLNNVPIYDDLFDNKLEGKIDHIELSRKNDLVLIYPATASFIAKISGGIADDLATATIIACNKPIFLAAAMNVEMWHNKITQENIEKLEKNSNIEIIYPESGKMACAEEGEGRIKNEQEVFKQLKNFFLYKNKLQGKKVLITLGGTIEKIDEVRYISNFSSGKQGVAIARKLLEYGAKVTIIKANSNCRMPAKARVIEAFSTDKMHKEVFKEIENSKYDYGFFVAAVADFKVKNITKNKIKKTEEEDVINLSLVKNPDILQATSIHKNRPETLIGFSAETDNHLKNSKQKLVKKKCDYIILNDVKGGKVFNSENNNIIIIDKSGKTSKIQGSKDKIALELIKNIILKI